MNYFIARNGQTFGPYPEEAVRKYLAEGSMQASDLGRTDAMPNWAPLSQILAVSPGAPPPPFPAPPQAGYTPPLFAAPGYTAPVHAAPGYVAPGYVAPGYPASGMNIPPGLSWIVVLVIAAFTSGLFITIWAFIQANWIRSIDPASRAVRDLAIGIFFPIVGGIIFMVMLAASGIAGALDNPSVAVIGSMASGFLLFMCLGIGGLIFTLKAFFSMRDSLERYYNSTEPINLRLSPVMTFFFNVIYFQYHLSRIVDWKRTGVLRP